MDLATKFTIPPRCGQTARFKGIQIDLEYTVYKGNDCLRLDDKTMLYPKTIIDTMFPNHDVSLNRNKLWETMIDTLETHCIKKVTNVTRWGKSPDDLEVVYTLPVTGEQFVKECVRYRLSACHEDISDYFMIGNTKLFRNGLYIRTDESTFIKTNKFKYVDTYEMKIKRVYGKLSYKSKFPCSIYQIQPINNTINCSRFRGTGPTDPTGPSGNCEFVTIDLGCNMEITHISTMGKYTPIYTFPMDLAERRFYNISHEKTANYYTDTSTACVTKYNVDVRVDHGRKWIRIDSFMGNLDRTTELIYSIDIGFPVRYVRVIPVSFNNNTSMQIGLFTQGDSKMIALPTTLDYTVNIPSKRKFVTDGYLNRRGIGSYKKWDRCNYYKHLKNLARRRKKKCQRARNDWNTNGRTDE